MDGIRNDPARWRRPSALLLIAMNLVPLVGVVAFGWSVGALMLLYWAETVVIGVLNIPRLLTAGMGSGDGFGRGCGAVFITGFFIVHYGLFNFGHYSFLQEFFTLPALDTGLLIALAGLAASHLFSLFVNWFGKGEYKDATSNAQMVRPYGRVFVMHVVIIIGGFLSDRLGEPLAPLILLVALKIVVDLYAHTRSHETDFEYAT